MTCVSLSPPARELNKGGISESCENPISVSCYLHLLKDAGERQSGRAIVIAFVLMNAWLLLCEVGRMSRIFFVFCFEQGLNSFGMIKRRFGLCQSHFGDGNGGATPLESRVCVCVRARSRGQERVSRAHSDSGARTHLSVTAS